MNTVLNLQIVDPTRAAILQKIKSKQAIITGCQDDICDLEKVLALFPDPSASSWTTTVTGTGSGIMNYSIQ